MGVLHESLSLLPTSGLGVFIVAPMKDHLLRIHTWEHGTQKHLPRMTLYTQGAVPFSVLLASSIVQDGHGMLPLLADSRLDFLRVKGISFAAGMLIGLAAYFLGW